jgi:hypothetical protein
MIPVKVSRFILDGTCALMPSITRTPTNSKSTT